MHQRNIASGPSTFVNHDRVSQRLLEHGLRGGTLDATLLQPAAATPTPVMPEGNRPWRNAVRITHN